MSDLIPRGILEAVELARQREEAELAEAARAEAERVIARTAEGGGNIDQTFALNLHFRLVYVRGHFVGGAGRADLRISVDSAQGSAFDAHLFTVRVVGTGADVHLRLSADESAPPSAWAFQPGDAVRIEWTNPDSGNMTWGLEVGLAPA